MSPCVTGTRNEWGDLDPDRPYIVVQTEPGVDAFAALVRHHPEWFAAYQIVACPIGPVLGDDVAIIEREFPNLVRLPDYLHPQLLASLIAGASAVVGSSLHLGISAVAFSVPVFRPARATNGKYAVLSRHETVHGFGDEIALDWFAAKLAGHATDGAMAGIRARLVFCP